MREYLGVEVSNNQEGVLQDVHWFAGLIGYFPSYALGNVYASQLFHSMKQDLDLTEYSQETIRKIRLWLGENIHQYGKCKTTTELIREITGEDLNPSYYIQYLKENTKHFTSKR